MRQSAAIMAGGARKGSSADPPPKRLSACALGPFLAHNTKRRRGAIGCGDIRSQTSLWRPPTTSGTRPDAPVAHTKATQCRQGHATNRPIFSRNSDTCTAVKRSTEIAWQCSPKSNPESRCRPRLPVHLYGPGRWGGGSGARLSLTHQLAFSKPP